MLEYFRAWFATAVSQAFGRADAVAGAIGIFGPLVYWLCGASPRESLAWQIPTCVFAADLCYRLALAPYRLHQALLKRLAKAEQDRDAARQAIDIEAERESQYRLLGKVLCEANELFAREAKSKEPAYAWIDDFRAWRERALAEIGRGLSPAHVARFRAFKGNSLTMQQRHYINDAHLKCLNELADHIGNLGIMMDQLASSQKTQAVFRPSSASAS